MPSRRSSSPSLSPRRWRSSPARPPDRSWPSKRPRCSRRCRCCSGVAFPFAAPALVFAGVAGVSLVSPAGVTEGATFAMLGLVLACWAAGAQREGQQALAGAALGLAAFAVIVQARPGSGTTMQVGDAEVDIVSWLVIGIGLPLGAFALRRREERAAALEEEAERLAREREERARAAVAAERARIARDLHDVIAHSVSVMTVQGGAARLLLEQDARRARESLLAVEETGHQAMAEMRRLLGLVHAEDDSPALAPQPGLADLEALVEQLRTGGPAGRAACARRPTGPGSGRRARGLSNRAGGPHERAQARRPGARLGDRPLRARCPRARDRRRRPRRGERRRRRRPRPRAACANGWRSTAASSRPARAPMVASPSAPGCRSDREP